MKTMKLLEAESTSVAPVVIETTNRWRTSGVIICKCYLIKKYVFILKMKT